jgi:hypothetical protein
MNSYGVVPVWDYLLSIPGAVLYLLSVSLGVALSWGLASGDSTGHFKLTKFAVLALIFSSLTTLFWIQLGVWFYVKA